jgi:hypothetical protein
VGDNVTDDQKPEEQSTEPESTSIPAPLNVSRRSILFGLVSVALIVLLIAAVRQGNDDPAEEMPVIPTVQEDVNNVEEAGGGETGDVELGSVTLSAHVCPTLDSPDEQCMTGETAEVTALVLELPDGSEVDLGDATQMPDGSYIWLNVPVGVYQLQAEELGVPEGYVARNVAGPVIPNEEGWQITNTDPNQPAVIRILFAPVGGTPAVG